MKIKTLRMTTGVQKVVDLLKEYRTLFGAVGTFAAGVLGAGATMLGGMSPFSMAICGAFPMSTAFVALMGTVTGGLLRGGAVSMRHLASCGLIFVLKWMVAAYDPMKRLVKRVWFGPVVTLVSALGVGAYTTTAFGVDVAALAGVASEALIACAICYFITETLRAFETERPAAFSKNQRWSALMALGLMVTMLSAQPVAEVSPGRILAGILVLCMAGAGARQMGAAAGVGAGLCVGVISSKHLFMVGTFGVSGLLAGVFAAFGRVGSAAAYIVAQGLAVLFSGGELTTLIEVTVSAMVYMLLPQRWLAKLGGMAAGREAAREATDTTAFRLRTVAEAISAAAGAADLAAESLSTKEEDNLTAVYERSAAMVCGKCPKRMECWEQHFGDTMDALGALSVPLRERGSAEPDDLPAVFRARCRSPLPLVEAVNREREIGRRHEGAKRRVGTVRSASAEQLGALAALLNDLAEKTAGGQESDPVTAGKVRGFLEERGLPAQAVACALDDRQRMTLEIKVEAQGIAVSAKKLALELGDVCGRRFSMPHITRTPEHLLVRLGEEAALRCRFGSAQSSKPGGEPCGDSAGHFSDHNGRATLLLSDGMGTGARAATDSRMTVNMLAGLLSAGVSSDVALSLVNAALIASSEDESLSTVDVCRIDLFSGRTELCKAGAAPTYLRLAGRVGRAECGSLPAGILGGVRFERSALTLRSGDMVVMVSDGAVSGGGEWLCAELSATGETDPQALARHLLEEAKRRRTDLHQDDITVLVAMIVPGEEE